MFTPNTLNVIPSARPGAAARIDISGNNGWHICRFTLTPKQAQSLINQLEAALQDYDKEQQECLEQ